MSHSTTTTKHLTMGQAATLDLPARTHDRDSILKARRKYETAHPNEYNPVLAVGVLFQRRRLMASAAIDPMWDGPVRPSDHEPVDIAGFTVRPGEPRQFIELAQLGLERLHALLAESAMPFGQIDAYVVFEHGYSDGRKSSLEMGPDGEMPSIPQWKDPLIEGADQIARKRGLDPDQRIELSTYAQHELRLFGTPARIGDITLKLERYFAGDNQRPHPMALSYSVAPRGRIEPGVLEGGTVKVGRFVVEDGKSLNISAKDLNYTERARVLQDYARLNVLEIVPQGWGGRHARQREITEKVEQLA